MVCCTTVNLFIQMSLTALRSVRPETVCIHSARSAGGTG